MQIKQVILMGVSDQEFIQELISIITTQSLDEIVQHCYVYEAAKHTATAITSPSKSACTVSRYKKGKKRQTALARVINISKRRMQQLSWPPRQGTMPSR